MTTPTTDIQTVLDANLPAAFKGLKIIDTDTHFSGPTDLYARHAPASMEGPHPATGRSRRQGDVGAQR